MPRLEDYGGTFRYSLLGLFIAWLSLLFSSNYPSDEAMMRQFRWQEATFDELAELMQDRPDIRTLRRDRVFYEASPHPVEPGNEPELRRLMKRLRIESVRRTSASVRMELIGNDTALFHSNPKGFVYLLEPPHPNSLVEDLDEVENHGRTYYRHIKGNWYLYVEADRS